MFTFNLFKSEEDLIWTYSPHASKNTKNHMQLLLAWDWFWANSFLILINFKRWFRFILLIWIWFDWIVMYGSLWRSLIFFRFWFDEEAELSNRYQWASILFNHYNLIRVNRTCFTWVIQAHDHRRNLVVFRPKNRYEKHKKKKNCRKRTRYRIFGCDFCFFYVFWPQNTLEKYW